jgi:hypothetical protein
MTARRSVSWGILQLTPGAAPLRGIAGEHGYWRRKSSLTTRKKQYRPRGSNANITSDLVTLQQILKAVRSRTIVPMRAPPKSAIALQILKE